MTRMTGPDCAVMCNLINTHTHTTCIKIFCFLFIYLTPDGPQRSIVCMVTYIVRIWINQVSKGANPARGDLIGEN